MITRDIPILLRPLRNIPHIPLVVILQPPERIPEGYLIERPMPPF